MPDLPVSPHGGSPALCQLPERAGSWPDRARELGVLVVVAQFDVFVLAAQRRQAQEDVGLAQQVGDWAVAGPGLQHGVAVPGEDADAARPAGPGGPGRAPVARLRRMS